MMSHWIWDYPLNRDWRGVCQEIAHERFPIDCPDEWAMVQRNVEHLKRSGQYVQPERMTAYFSDSKKVERFVMLMWVDGIWLDRVPEGLARQMNRIPVYERRSPWRFLALKRDGYVEYIPHGILT